MLLKYGTERNVSQRGNTLFPTERIITAYTRIAYRHIIVQLLEAIITLSDNRLEELCHVFVDYIPPLVIVKSIHLNVNYIIITSKFALYRRM